MMCVSFEGPCGVSGNFLSAIQVFSYKKSFFIHFVRLSHVSGSQTIFPNAPLKRVKIGGNVDDLVVVVECVVVGVSEVVGVWISCSSRRCGRWWA